MAKKWARYSISDGSPSWAQELVDELFACTQPQFNLEGKKIFRLIAVSELDHLIDVAP